MADVFVLKNAICWQNEKRTVRLFLDLGFFREVQVFRFSQYSISISIVTLYRLCTYRDSHSNKPSLKVSFDELCKRRFCF